MTRTARSWLLAVGLVCSAAACSSGPSLSDMPTKEATVYCQKVFSCCTSGEANDGGVGTTQASCVSTMTSALSTTQAQSGLSKSRMAYRSDVAQECLDVYGGLSCSDLKSSTTSDVPACSSYLEPLVAPGGACDSDTECIGGTCQGGSSSQDGTCVSDVGAGASCITAHCGESLYCNAVPDAGSVCEPLLVDGSACVYNERCVNGGCNGMASAPDGGGGTCGLKGGSGTTCYLTTGCSSVGPGGLAGLIAVAIALGRKQRSRRSV